MLPMRDINRARFAITPTNLRPTIAGLAIISAFSLLEKRIRQGLVFLGGNFIPRLYFWIFSKLVDQNFSKNKLRVRKERKIAPQASAGNPLGIKILLAFRKKKRRRGNKVSEKSQNPLPHVRRDLCLMIASKMTFLSDP
jgi:hypothetical protein